MEAHRDPGTIRHPKSRFPLTIEHTFAYIHTGASKAAVFDMDRKIACLRIPAFEIELARLADPSLKGRPIAIATCRASRAVLHDVSEEGQDAGLYPGMLVEHARRLCPAIRIVESSPGRVRRRQH